MLSVACEDYIDNSICNHSIIRFFVHLLHTIVHSLVHVSMAELKCLLKNIRASIQMSTHHNPMSIIIAVIVVITRILLYSMIAVFFLYNPSGFFLRNESHKVKCKAG